MDKSNEFIVANTSLFICFRLAQEKSRDTKTTKFMVGGVGLHGLSSRE